MEFKEDIILWCRILILKELIVHLFQRIEQFMNKELQDLQKYMEIIVKAVEWEHQTNFIVNNAMIMEIIVTPENSFLFISH